MKFFENLAPSMTPKKSISNPFAHLVCQKAKQEGIKLEDNFEYLENLEAENLLRLNKQFKYHGDLVKLWAILDMRKYLECYFDLTVNPYIDPDTIVKDLDHYPNLPSKYQNILDVKLIEKFKLENVYFKKVYIATFELKDETYGFYRPYVELFTKDSNGNFYKIGYGFDTNNNRAVELFIDNFNYAVFLYSKGYIQLPLKNNRVKLSVRDFINDSKIKKLTSNLNLDYIEIKK